MLKNVTALIERHLGHLEEILEPLKGLPDLLGETSGAIENLNRSIDKQNELLEQVIQKLDETPGKGPKK